MQTLIDPFELSYSTKAFSRSGEHRSGAQSGPRLIPPADLSARHTLLDVDEIAWAGDDDDLDEEPTLDLDLDAEMPRRQLPPRGRGARVWTSEE